MDRTKSRDHKRTVDREPGMGGSSCLRYGNFGHSNGSYGLIKMLELAVDPLLDGVVFVLQRVDQAWSQQQTIDFLSETIEELEVFPVVNVLLSECLFLDTCTSINQVVIVEDVGEDLFLGEVGQVVHDLVEAELDEFEPQIL